MKKLNYLGLLILVVLVTSSLTGCSVAVYRGIGLPKTVVETDTRQNREHSQKRC